MMTLAPQISQKTSKTEKNLNPRDVQVLESWKAAGIELISVTISQLSPFRGQLLSNVPLPPNTRVACILRKGMPVLNMTSAFIKEQDVLYLLSDNERAVREQFIA